ncbi:phosphatidylserine decarboxylase [Deinococcus maricopensis]|uniref:Phosphatidylserine decarboxylase-related protein n=1 Tax=Deinococcus maricopensis (strain DSM 21211 / LMG 22137 / NRRL B-23946 / LB-34) TaxID=709986 RepID=E8U808_DEIML|nr:phosphatidylserine decarboxylase [Deinococcus maricopensis]ADV67197.1 phosphatidylserine decarboxylase-related protein [Deinococcus maricopensis DSM 21211]
MRVSRTLRLLLPAALLGAAALFVRRVWAYRDPIRITPRETDVLVSPTDGVVVYLRRIENGLIHADGLAEPLRVQELTHAPWPADPAPGSGWLLGIHRGVMDAHFTYAPLEADVTGNMHLGARANLRALNLADAVQLNAMRRPVNLLGRRYALENERQTLFLQRGDLPVAVVDVASGASSGQTYVRAGERVRAGQKVGFRALGAHVDVLVFREDVEWLVGVGDTVVGAETPLARLK